MLDIKHTLRTHPSLLPLRMALTIAEKEAPARPVIQITADEKRARMLIEKMKAEFDKRTSFENFVRQTPATKDFVFQLQAWEVVEANA